MKLKVSQNIWFLVGTFFIVLVLIQLNYYATREMFDGGMHTGGGHTGSMSTSIYHHPEHKPMKHTSREHPKSYQVHTHSDAAQKKYFEPRTGAWSARPMNEDFKE